MASTEKVNRAAEAFAERTADSYKVVVDHVVGSQERNYSFFRGWIDSFAGEVRHQAEANRAMTQEIVERAKKQREALRTVTEESFDAYWDFAFAPFSYYQEGLEQVAQVSDIITGLPIANYDELTVADISQKLDSLPADDIKKVRAYEKSHKDRDSLIEQFDRKIKAVS